MGTSISAFFPHTLERPSAAIRPALDAAMAGLQDDLATIRAGGRFSEGVGIWSLWMDEEVVRGEGPAGLIIDVYGSVAEFTSLERFGAIQDPDQGLHFALRRVFERVAAAFDGNGRFAIAAGGLGDTDAASDLVADGATFTEVCTCLEHVIGPPARTWEVLEAGLGSWYLSAD